MRTIILYVSVLLVALGDSFGGEPPTGVEEEATKAIEEAWAQISLSCVIIGHVKRLVPEFATGTQIRDWYALVEVVEILRQADELSLPPLRKYDYRAGAAEEGEKPKNLVLPPLKVGEVLVVRLNNYRTDATFGCKIVNFNHIVVMSILPIRNQLEFFELLVAARVEDDEKTLKYKNADEIKKALKEKIAHHGLQNIPEGAKWVQVAGNDILERKGVTWRDFFRRMEVTARLKGLLGARDDETIKAIESLNLEKNEDRQKLESARHHQSRNVRWTVAEKLLESGDTQGFKIFAELIRWCFLPPEPPYSTHYEDAGAMMRAEGRNWLDLLKKYEVVPFVNDKSYQVQDVLDWLEKDHTTHLTFDAEKKKFVVKPVAPPAPKEPASPAERKRD